jgi:hypothetical protein
MKLVTGAAALTHAQAVGNDMGGPDPAGMVISPELSPQPPPLTPPQDCVPHNVLIAFSDVNVQPATLQADIAAEPGVLSVDTFDAGNTTWRTHSERTRASHSFPQTSS